MKRRQSDAFQHVRRLGVAVALLTTAGAIAQPLPGNAQIKINVLHRTAQATAAFRNIGLFKLVQGDLPFDSGSCPSRSNAKGEVECSMICKTDGTTETTLLLMPPELVTGFETPVAVEVALLGCSVAPRTVEFTYTLLQIALAETMSAAPELARIVVGPPPQQKGVGSPPVTFSQIRSFPEVQSELQAYIARNPHDVHAQRFARLMRDAATGGGQAVSPATARRLQDFSTGTQSIYLNNAVGRSLGPDKATQLAPITFNAKRLQIANEAVRVELASKPDRAPAEVRLQEELGRLKTKPAAAATPAVDWRRVERAQQAPMKGQ